MNHPQALATMETVLADGTALPAELAVHLQQCPECAATWDALTEAERALEGDAGLSARALAALENRVLLSVPTLPRPGLAAWARRFLLPVAPLALATAAVFLWVSPRVDGGFQARGGADDLAAPVRVRLLCVGSAGVRGDVVSTAEVRTLHCGQQDVLGFALTVNPDNPWTSLFLVGVGPDGQPRWYHPRPEEKESVALPREPVADQPLPGVRLDVNHREGTTRVYAVYSHRPLSVEEVRQAVARGSMESALGEALGGDVLVQAVEMVIP